MMFSEDVLKKIFEKSFNDKVEKNYSVGPFICFSGKKRSMNYNPIDGCIIFSRKSGGRIGTIFLHNGSDAFFEINPESNSGCYVGLFLSELKKYIESSKKRTRRKFIAR